MKLLAVSAAFDVYELLHCGQESLRRNGKAIIVNKRVQNAVFGCSLKNDRMISVRFQGKSFNIMIIQVYAPTSNAEQAEVEQFHEDLQDLLELTPKKDVLFIIGDWSAKVGGERREGNTCVCVVVVSWSETRLCRVKICVWRVLWSGSRACV